MLRNIVMMTWFLFCWILAVQAIWDRYEIDALEASNDTNFMNGADGIDFADFNEDGHDDAVVCYEESGFVSAFLYPGKESVQEPWPEIQISNLSVGAEMSIWVDADGDGCLDVCVTREGDSRVVEIFWCDPQNKTRELWPSNTFPDAPSLEWMTAVANDVNRDGNMDIVIGSKKILAEIGWLEAPSKDKRNTSAWTYHKIAPATWIMSLFVRDMDGDGEEDLAVTDRQGLFRWFQYPGAGLENGLWPEYPVGQRNEPEGDLTKLLLFGGFGDVNGDGATDAVAATDFESGSLGVTIFYRTTPDDSFPEWGPSEFLLLPPSLTKAKAANPGDLTLDGKMEIAFSCEVRGGENHCVGYFVQTDVGWEYIDVSGSVGQKFDDIILRDIDLDGDLDMVTCEEVDDLGVIWYKNPRNIFFEGFAEKIKRRLFALFVLFLFLFLFFLLLTPFIGALSASSFPCFDSTTGDRIFT